MITESERILLNERFNHGYEPSMRRAVFLLPLAWIALMLNKAIRTVWKLSEWVIYKPMNWSIIGLERLLDWTALKIYGVR